MAEIFIGLVVIGILSTCHDFFFYRRSLKELFSEFIVDLLICFGIIGLIVYLKYFND